MLPIDVRYATNRNRHAVGQFDSAFNDYSSDGESLLITLSLEPRSIGGLKVAARLSICTPLLVEVAGFFRFRTWRQIAADYDN